MKNLSWRLTVTMWLAAFVCWGGITSSRAADEAAAGSPERMERLEQRINELTQRQAQMRRPEGGPDRAQPAPMQNRERMANGAPLQNMPGPGNPGVPGAAAAKIWKDIAGMLHLCFLIGIIFNVLTAMWIFSDIRKRGEGSGVFVALALLAGAPAAVIYCLARIGDRKI